MSLLDTHFASFMENLSGAENPHLNRAAQLLSEERGQGMIYLDLPEVFPEKDSS